MPKLRLLAVLFALGTVGRAQTTIQLSGTISSVSGTSLFVVGQPFTIEFGYSTGVADLNSDLRIGLYDAAITSFEFNYASGSYIGAATNGRFFIYNNFELGTDAVQMDNANNTSFPAVDGNEFNSGSRYFYLTNNDGTLFSSDALPDNFPTTGWDSGQFQLGWGEDFDSFEPLISLNGSITSVAPISAVPEPSAAAAIAGLLALGAALAWHRRPRRA